MLSAPPRSEVHLRVEYRLRWWVHGSQHCCGDSRIAEAPPSPSPSPLILRGMLTRGTVRLTFWRAVIRILLDPSRFAGPPLLDTRSLWPDPLMAICTRAEPERLLLDKDRRGARRPKTRGVGPNCGHEPARTDAVKPSKHETLIQGLFNVGPASATLDQH